MDHLTEELLDERTVFGGKVIDVRLRTVRMPDGGIASREVVLHKGAAAIVAVDERGRIALVRQFRSAIGDTLLELPAGKKDSQEEDPLRCARRELREETGLTADSMTLLTQMLTTPGFSSEIISIYLATGLSQGETNRDEDEFLDVLWEDFDSAVQKVLRGEIRDGKTALGILLAREILEKETR